MEIFEFGLTQNEHRLFKLILKCSHKALNYNGYKYSENEISSITLLS